MSNAETAKAHPKLCRCCEYFDGGGLDMLGFPKEFHGDCLNRHSPRFETTADNTCRQFYLGSQFRPDSDFD